MSHTKGPWAFYADDDHDGVMYRGIITANERAIANIFRHHDRNNRQAEEQTDLDNAALFAAAPAMLEALEDVLNYSAITDDFADDMKNRRYGNGLLIALHHAKGVIALAKGQERMESDEPTH